MGTNLEVFLEGTVLGLATLLTLVAVASYARSRSKRALGLGLAFLVLAVKGLLLLSGTLAQDTALSALDLGLLGLVYFSLLSG